MWTNHNITICFHLAQGGRSKRGVKWAIVRSLKYESVNDDARIEGDGLSTKLGN